MQPVTRRIPVEARRHGLRQSQLRTRITVPVTARKAIGHGPVLGMRHATVNVEVAFDLMLNLRPIDHTQGHPTIFAILEQAEGGPDVVADRDIISF